MKVKSIPKPITCMDDLKALSDRKGAFSLPRFILISLCLLTCVCLSARYMHKGNWQEPVHDIILTLKVLTHHIMILLERQFSDEEYC